MSTPDVAGPTAGSSRRSADTVTWGVRVAASWSWRALVVLGLLYVLSRIVSQLSVVVIPVAVAVLLAALLSPAVGWLHRHRVPRGVATALVLIGGIGLLATVLTFVVRAFVTGLPDLESEVGRSVTAVENWLVTGPFRVDQGQIANLGTSVTDAIRSNSAAVTSGALTTAAVVGEVITGAAIALFTTIFFVYDGGRVWHFVLRAVPAGTRGRVDVAGERGFASLVGYVRATVAVAAVDAIGIGIGLAVLRVPLALPLAALVFLGAFVPILGAVLGGAVAVLVALVSQGFVVALVVLGIVLAVQQLEAHVLQPLLLGRAVQLHPLAVVLSIASGLVVAGIMGALLVVPMVAVLNSAIRSLAEDEPTPEPDEVDATDPDEAMPPGAGDRDDEGYGAMAQRT